MVRILLLSISLAASLALPFSAVEGAGVGQSRHNLSASGPGAVRATAENRMCEFCHTPHHTQSALPAWNKEAPDTLYTTYQSSTLKAAVGQPNGASRLCLTCHDGTIALGAIKNRKQSVTFAGGLGRMPGGKANLGTDLSDDHPISFVYDSALASRDLELVHPASLRGAVKLDKFGQLQCNTCHDPHNDQNGKFLAVANTSSALCLTCHNKAYWSGSTHRTSTKTWNGMGPDPWLHTSEKTVAANGCENCHRPHTAGGHERLLNYPVEESNCYPCHNGNVATTNIQAEFTKMSAHPVGATTGVHNPAEGAASASRHVECADCHNPHGVNGGTAAAPNVTGRLAGLAGIDASGASVKPLVYEYQLCFRCHGDQPGTRTPRITRHIQTTPANDFRLKFQTANASYHPVEATGKNPNVPSLVAPYTVGSIIYCTDCHNNNAGKKAGGTGPNGPHGSSYLSLLERQQLTADNTPESTANYALCYKCHSRTSILANASFSQHNRHIVSAMTPCTVCHDPHGVATASHLINFDRSVVTPSSSGRLEFLDSGTNRGNCYLTCHGKNHNPLSY